MHSLFSEKTHIFYFKMILERFNTSKSEPKKKKEKKEMKTKRKKTKRKEKKQ